MAATDVTSLRMGEARLRTSLTLGDTLVLSSPRLGGGTPFMSLGDDSKPGTTRGVGGATLEPSIWLGGSKVESVSWMGGASPSGRGRTGVKAEVDPGARAEVN